MKRIYFVDQEMCGNDLPLEFDLEEFCEFLQGKLTDVEVVALTEPGERAFNRDHTMVPDSVFHEALGEYCPR